jgi:hypothetical protein
VVATLYALEMMMETHAVETHVVSPVPVFDKDFLEKCREELSLSSFFWHLRPFTALARGIAEGLKLHFTKNVSPLLREAERRYGVYWDDILPTLRRNVKFVKSFWKKHGGSIIREIVNVSRHPWTTDEIQVFFVEPIVGGHGDAFPHENVVTIEAIKTRSVKPIIGIVHEIAHVNTMIPFKSIFKKYDIRSKVLYEIANEYLAHQAMINAKVIEKFDFDRMERTFTESIQGWMTESRTKFKYNPRELKSIVDGWWKTHLRSDRKLLESFADLQEEALPTMKIEKT